MTLKSESIVTSNRVREHAFCLAASNSDSKARHSILLKTLHLRFLCEALTFITLLYVKAEQAHLGLDKIGVQNRQGDKIRYLPFHSASQSRKERLLGPITNCRI